MKSLLASLLTLLLIVASIGAGVHVGGADVRSPQAADVLRPSSSPHIAATEPGTLGKPPRIA